MKKITAVAVLLVLCAYGRLQGQNNLLHGRVIDIKTGAPIAGAAITLQHTKKIYLTATDGSFIITLNAPVDTILITHISYRLKQVPVSLLHDGLLVTLDEQEARIDDVVVSTGYQEIPKERATGSFVNVDKTLLDKRVAPDIISKLDGITSGLLFSKGVPGRGTELGIRGQSTLFANAEPLIVVDNFPFEGDINAINPNDVASVTVLKDAAAASIWGVRAGNGVIVITTKKGSYNRPLQVSVNANVSVGEKPDLFYDPQFLASPAFIDMENFLFNQGFYDADLAATDYRPYSPAVNLLFQARQGLIAQADADAQLSSLKRIDIRNEYARYFYRNPVHQQYSLSLQGGSEKAAYYFSAGYDGNTGAALGADDNRITLHTYDVFRPVKKLELSAGIDYSISKTHTDNTLSQLSMGGPQGKNIYPYAALADAAGNPLPVVKDYTLAFTAQAESNGFLNWQFYPLQELRNGYNTGTSSMYQSRITAGLRYEWLPGLTADIKYQFEKGTGNGSNLANALSYQARNEVNMFSVVSPEGEVLSRVVPEGGILDLSNSLLTAQNIRSQLNYNKIFTRHTITVLAGFEARQAENESNWNRLYGYNDALATFTQVDPTNYYTVYPTGYSYKITTAQNISSTLSRFQSYYANAAYTYNNRYTLSASGRMDASNYFGVAANKKHVPLWSAGFKWDASKEPFYHAGWLPLLQLRVTYGVSGNLNTNITALTTARYNNSAVYTGLPYLTITNPPNKDLGWEKTAMVNAGIDFSTANNVITATIEYYHKKGFNLIGDNALAPSTGFINLNTFTNTVKGNYAGMKGGGWDIQLTTKNADGQFKWTTRLIFSYTTDKVTHYDGSSQPSDLVYYGAGANGMVIPNEGKPVYGVYGFRWAGLDAETGDPLGYIADTTSKDYAALTYPASATGITYGGAARPVFFGGMLNSFSWKGFSLWANISYKLGYYFRRSSINYYNLFYYYNGHKDYEKRWQQKGDEQKTQVPSMIYPADYTRDIFYNNSAVLIEKGDYIRLQDISLSYNFSNSLLQRWHIASLQVYAYINNVGLLWTANKQGIDPDYPSGIPPSRTYAIGFRTNF